MQTTDSGLRDPSKGWVASLITWSIQNKLLVLIGAVVLLVGGVRAVQSTPLDAVPDMTDTQVIVRTEFPGQSPQLVEDLVSLLRGFQIKIDCNECFGVPKHFLDRLSRLRAWLFCGFLFSQGGRYQ